MALICALVSARSRSRRLTVGLLTLTVYSVGLLYAVLLLNGV
jgi:hypothetical protein